MLHRDSIVKHSCFIARPARHDNKSSPFSHGANVHTTDDLQQTALWWTVNKWKHTIVSILLDHGADPLQEDSEGWTPLDESMSYYGGTSFKTILRLMEARGTQFGFTGLIKKAKRRRYGEHEENKLLKYLIQHHCHVMYLCA